MTGKKIAKRKRKNKYILHILIGLALFANTIATVHIINRLNNEYMPDVNQIADSLESNINDIEENLLTDYNPETQNYSVSYLSPNLYLTTIPDNLVSNIIQNQEVLPKEEPIIEPEPIVEEVKREPIPKLTRNTDLSTPIDITVEEMDAYISAFGNTDLKGYGKYFIEASEATGLNPLYLFGHAALESGFGSSNLAKNKGNYFGIGAYDRDPYNLAYVMGDTIYDGIIQGASWIKESYYDNGQTTLHSMIYGPKCYASSKEDWISQIASLASSKLSVINDNR